ncbi:hypothetical protein BN7874_195 [Phage NCTB]|nr:hypothetical protein BN7874_195 [Phage NCTB]
MYTLFSGPALANSYATHRSDVVSAWQHYNIFYGFTGPVPTSFDDITFDATSPIDVVRNCETAIHFLSDVDTTGQAGPGATRIDSQHLRTLIPTKQPYLDQTYSKWSLTPAVIVGEMFWHDDRNDNTAMVNAEYYINYSANSLSLTVLDLFKYDYRQCSVDFGLQRMWSKYRTRDRMLNLRDGPIPSVGSGYDWYSVQAQGGRYPYNYPSVFEFNEEVTLDSLEYWMGWYSGANYSPTVITLDVWDEATETWVDEQTINVAENTEIQYIELDTHVTGKAFRVKFGGTGGNDCYIGWLRFLTSTPPTAVPSVDITWGLICPFHMGSYSFSEIRDRYGYSVNGREFWVTNGALTNPDLYKREYPQLLVDVGGPNDGNTMTLNKARSIAPGEVPELLNFVLDFNDI